MAGQGNYVNVGGINANWGQGLSSSLSDLSRSLLAQASQAKDEEFRSKQAEEQRRQFELGHQRQLSQDAEAARQFELNRQRALAGDAEAIRQFNLGHTETTRINDSNLATAGQNREFKAAQEQERLQLVRNNETANNSLYDFKNSDKTIGQYAPEQITALNSLQDTLTGFRDVSINYRSNPTEDNLKLVEDMAAKYYGYTTSEKGKVNSDARGFADHLRYAVAGGADEDAVNNIFADDFNRFNSLVRSGSAIPLREQTAAWLQTLPENIRNTKSFGEWQDIYAKANPDTISRTALTSANTAAIEQAYNDKIDQYKAWNDYYDSMGKGSSGGSSAGSSGSDSKNLISLTEKDIGSIDNKRMRDAYVSLREQEGVTPDAAYAAVLSFIDSNWFGSSFPDIASDIKSGDSLLDRAKKLSGKGFSMGSAVKPEESRFRLSRQAATPIGKLLVEQLKFNPSAGLRLVGDSPEAREAERQRLQALDNATNGEFSVTAPNDAAASEGNSKGTNSSNYSRPAGQLTDLKKELEVASKKHLENLRKDPKDREVETVDTYKAVDALKKRINALQFSDRRIKEINEDIEFTNNLMNRPGISEEQKQQYKSRVESLLKQLEQHKTK